MWIAWIPQAWGGPSKLMRDTFRLLRSPNGRITPTSSVVLRSSLNCASAVLPTARFTDATKATDTEAGPRPTEVAGRFAFGLVLETTVVTATACAVRSAGRLLFKDRSSPCARGIERARITL